MTPRRGPLASIAQVYNASGHVTATYEYGNGLAAVVTGSGTDYYNADSEGNVTSLSGAGGALVDTYAYDPYGNLISSTGGAPNPFQYGGALGVFSVNSLYFMRARYYDPSLGRFITQDPSGLESPNLYAYALNNPVAGSDPTGYITFNLGVGAADYAGAGGQVSGGVYITTNNAYGLPDIGVYGSGGLGAGAEGGVSVSGGFTTGGTETFGGKSYEASGTAGIGGITVTGNDDGFTGIQLGSPGEIGGHVSTTYTQPIGVVDTVIDIINYFFPGTVPPKPGPPPVPPNTSRGPTAGGIGCPHFTTFDGLAFDFQGAGEFIASQSTKPGDDFQVQMRIEPEGSEIPPSRSSPRSRCRWGRTGSPSQRIAPRPQGPRPIRAAATRATSSMSTESRRT